MADSFLGVADLLKINDLNTVEIGSDLLQDAPFLSVLAADTSSQGDVHYYLKETTAASPDFRAVNTGREFSGTADTVVTATLKILDASFAVDKALADTFNKGPQALIEREAMRHMKAAMFKLEQQVINGVTSPGDAGGFVGIRSLTTNVVDAAGTTASTGSSVYMVRTVPDLSELVVVLGNEGEFTMGDPIVQDMNAADSHYPVYYVPMCGYTGLQLGTIYAVCRIKNLTEDANKGLTDTLLAKALEKFPSGRQPTHIVMNRRSLRQLQTSRTSYSPTGFPAPRPIEYEGIPIVVTDGISSTEAIA